MKYLRQIIFLFSVIYCLSACSKDMNFENNAYFEDVAEVSYVKIVSNIESDNEIWRTEDSGEILSIMSMFNNWIPANNQAEPLDLILEYSIHFDDVLTVYYSPSSRENNYYGQIDNVYYYLPAAFGEYIDNILTMG